MSDPALRELERALRASPRDVSLSRRYLQELRRAGQVAPDAAPDAIEPVPNPGIRRGDLVLVTRRSRPRAAFAWLPEMDALLGTVLEVVRVPVAAGVGERDGLSCLVEGPSCVAGARPGDPVIGRSLGFGSTLVLRAT